MARVLVVDDDPIYRDLLQVMLERCGHAVVTAESGFQCLQLLGKLDGCGDDAVDLVITDLFMPHMDGAELIVAIREQFRRPLPLIGMTGGFSDLVRPYTRSLLKLGSDAVLAKPFTEQDLSAAVLQALGRTA